MKRRFTIVLEDASPGDDFILSGEGNVALHELMADLTHDEDVKVISIEIEHTEAE